MKYLGYVLIALPFIATIIFAIATIGVGPTLVVVGITVIIMVVLVVGMWLVANPSPMPAEGHSDAA